jgi:phosphatidylglycerophosphate synthase
LTRNFGKGALVLDWKLLADTFTLLRGLLGLGLVWLGVDLGVAALPYAAWILLLCWAGDFFDGRMARRASQPRRTWIGDHDVYVDVLVSLCLGLYLVAAGFASGLFGIIYLFAWALIFRIVGQNHGYLMLVQAPIYAWFIWVTLREAPQAGIWLIGWLAFVLLVNWSRFAHEVVPGFIEDVKNSARRPRDS